jgi:hypothetical protein
LLAQLSNQVDLDAFVIEHRRPIPNGFQELECQKNSLVRLILNLPSAKNWELMVRTWNPIDNL